MSLLTDHNLPFAAALVLMALLALLQVVGVSEYFGHEVEAHGADGGMADGLLALIGFSRVPFMMWLATFLLAFAALGVSGQALAESLLGTALNPWLAAGLATIAALPLTGILVRPLSAIIPKDETTAVGLDSLVGRRAKIVNGRAGAGHPARARVRDRFGHPHHVMVEPHEQGAEMLEGDEVLLVRRENDTFFCIAIQDRALGPV